MLKPSRKLTALPHRLIAAAALPLAATGALALAVPGTASASHTQITIMQDDNLLLANPTATLEQMKALGASTVRVVLYWDAVAPDAASKSAPKHFNAADPADYAASKWAPYDAIVRDAASMGLTLDLTVQGAAPRWAEGSGIPSNYLTAHNPGAKYFAWKPSAKDFGEFMQAVGKRYSGTYTPGGQTKLPGVHFWSIWNEPNFGEYMGPQAADTSRYISGAAMYRNIVRSGYSALEKTGHTHNTILIGELAAHGYGLSDGKHGRTYPQGLPGNSGQSQPIPFMQTLYCLNSKDQKLAGTAAKQVGCPTTAAGRAAFRKDNPGLFDTSGVGDHPYANNATPASDGKGNPNWSTLPNLGKLESVLDTATHAWGSTKHFAIYNDEYGYITDPPQTNKSQSVSVAKAAQYINWAEYITYNEPRVASYDQYLIDDGSPNAANNNNGGFATGLYTSGGKPKATLNAFRLPLWLSSTTLKRPGVDKVWGEARPAGAVKSRTRQAQTVKVQFQAGGKGAWKTIDTLHTTSYFTVRPKFTTSGDVRLSYTYPSAASDSLLPVGIAGATITSRTQKVTVK